MTTSIYSEVAAKVETSKITEHHLSISGMLKKLGVSRSGYRAFCNHKSSASSQRKDTVKAQIRKIYDGSKQNYGVPKITRELKKQGFRITERTVGQYMKESGLRAQWVKPWIKTTKDSDFTTQLHNILDEKFNPDRPNAVWCSDITYIWTFDGFVYLTSVMDLYSRKIIAWTLSTTMDVSCVVDTIHKAKARRETTLPLILHSDHGSQYVSQAYRDAASRFQLSYSQKGYPYDNACIESFHSLIKREWLNRFGISNYNHAYRLVFEYIETFYNTVRIHSHCDWMPPDEYEKRYQFKISQKPKMVS